jgi:hypothetical protein
MTAFASRFYPRLLVVGGCSGETGGLCGSIGVITLVSMNAF